MRIAILADPLDNQSAGVHVYTRELIKALVARNSGAHEYILIRSKRSHDFPSLQQVVIPTVNLPIGWASFRLFVLVPRVCRRLQVDAVFEPAHFGPFNLSKHIKRITMIHDLTPILFPQYHRWHSQWLHERFLPGILSRADVVLANSEHTRRDIIQYQPSTEDKTVAIPLGINQQFQPISDDTVRNRYGLPEDYFLFLGTLEPRKNLLTLLKAFATYRAKGGQTALVLAGQLGWRSKALQRALAEHPDATHINLPGFVADADVPAVYSMAKAFVYPSEYEGFGFPVLEAMACGVPVIAAANSSLLEIGGAHAHFFPTKDFVALANLLHHMDRGIDRAKIASARAYAGSFTWQAYAERFEQTMSEIESH